MIENLENEVWMPIAGYEGLYEISNYSRIKSTKFKLHRIMNPNGKITEDGRYIKCRLRDGLGNDKIVSHHRVAAMHFVPNPDPSLYNEVNHIDGDRSNNHISNFEWTTHHENTLHGNLASRDGKSSKYKGVSRKKNRGDDTWVWSVYMNKEQHRKGGFKTEEEAFDDLMRFYRENKLSTKHLL